MEGLCLIITDNSLAYGKNWKITTQKQIVVVEGVTCTWMTESAPQHEDKFLLRVDNSIFRTIISQISNTLSLLLNVHISGRL